MNRSWKRTEVTIETETLVVSRRGSGAFVAHCEECGIETVMLTPGTAATLAGVTTELINACAEAGSVHCITLPGGLVLVCGLSAGAVNNKRKGDS